LGNDALPPPPPVVDTDDRSIDADGNRVVHARHIEILDPSLWRGRPPPADPDFPVQAHDKVLAYVMLASLFRKRNYTLLLSLKARAIKYCEQLGLSTVDTYKQAAVCCAAGMEVGLLERVAMHHICHPFLREHMDVHNRLYSGIPLSKLEELSWNQYSNEGWGSVMSLHVHSTWDWLKSFLTVQPVDNSLPLD